MNNVKFFIVRAIKTLLDRFSLFYLKLTWRLIALLILCCIFVLSGLVIALELTPSRKWVKTTFVATLEAQNLSIRIGEKNASITGVSGTKISARSTSSRTSETGSQNTDLTQLAAGERSNGEEIGFSYAKSFAASHLELDEMLIPSGRAVEIISTGVGRFMSVQALDDGEEAEHVDIAIVWNGPVSFEATTGAISPELSKIGRKRWSDASPIVEIEEAVFDESIYAPISVGGLSLERLRVNANDLISTSSLIAGEIQFDIMGQRGNSTTLRQGEFLDFFGLSAHLTNLVLSEKGVRFVLVGEADSVEVGYLDNRRSIQPTMLDALRSWESLGIIASSLFALFLAALSAVSLGKKD